MALKIFGATYSQNWIGGSALVVAENIEHAEKLINAHLAISGEYGKVRREDIIEVNTSVPGILELTNGDYSCAFQSVNSSAS